MFNPLQKYRDAEAKIIGKDPSVSGTWECELYVILFLGLHLTITNRPNGVRFVAPAGTTEFAKRWNPQPGDIVSFKHRGFMLSSNKPKVPTLYRIRDDLTWDDVVHNWNERIRTPNGNIFLL